MSTHFPTDARIYVAGHETPLGSLLCRRLRASGYSEIITRSAQELNLRNQLDVNLFFEQELPDYVFFVQDGEGNDPDQFTHPAEFLYGRLLGLSNVIHAAYVYEVRKLLNIVVAHDQGAAEPLLAQEEEFQAGAGVPSSDELLELVSVGLCDRYRRQYSCDFITARFQLDRTRDGGAPAARLRTGDLAQPALSPTVRVSAWNASEPAWEQLYSSDPTDACLFLMEHFSASGPITVRADAYMVETL